MLCDIRQLLVFNTHRHFYDLPAATCIVSIVESGRLVETEENDQSRRVREYW